MPNSYREIVGGLIMIGVPGTRVTPAVRKLIRAIRPGGVIFFRPNFESPELFLKLQKDLENAAGKKLLFAVDHEGGRVIHLAAGVTVFPDNQVIGNSGREDFARRQGIVEAAELRGLGIHLNLAPTLDVLGENFSPNIGIRSYGKSPRLVSRFGAARIKAMQAAGVAACAKHFPGQGMSPRDAHLDLPVLDSSTREMETVHFSPFRAAIKAGVASVMSSHPIYPRLDKIKQPATFSRKIIHGILREKMGFGGAILSDDLEMGALTGLCPIGESAVRAVQAGHDMVLVCHDGKKQLEVFEALVMAYENGRLDSWELEKSLVRTQSLIKRSSLADPPPRRGNKEGDRLSAAMAQSGVRRSAGHARFSFAKGEKVSVIFPALSSLARRIFIEKEMLDEKKYADAILKAAGLTPGVILKAGLTASAADIAAAKKIKGGRIFFCYDAHLDTGTRKLLAAFTRGSGKAAAVLLRDPYDIEFVSRKAACVSAFGFRHNQVLAAVKLLVK